MNKTKALIEGITADIILYLTEDDNIPIKEALKKVYNSAIFKKLGDEKTGLYIESSPYVYSLLKDEFKYGKIVQTEQ
ncbi:MAG: hypothetical protein LBM87_05875 [Ruminococcus sp.]|jgi:hypothetical protein|nr:hypothetical protein [Ruminococcus sp.]